MHCSSLPMIWAIRSVLCGAMLEKIFKRHPIFCKEIRRRRNENHDKSIELPRKKRERGICKRNLIYFSFNHRKITWDEIVFPVSISRSPSLPEFLSLPIERFEQNAIEWNQEVTSVSFSFLSNRFLSQTRQRKKRKRTNDKSLRDIISLRFHVSLSLVKEGNYCETKKNVQAKGKKGRWKMWSGKKFMGELINLNIQSSVIWYFRFLFSLSLRSIHNVN